MMHALRSMRGGDVVVRTYIQQAIAHARQFKKTALVTPMQQLLDELESTKSASSALAEEMQS